MNPRIRELAKQSGLWFVTPIEDLIDDFAELLIRECLRRIEGCGVDPTQYEFDKEFVLGYNKGVSKVASQVKLHFGVEE